MAAAARLSFGAAPGATLGVDSEQQARRLAAELAAELDSEMALRLFDDQQQLGRWLNDFAMLDLGIMDAEFLAAHPGEFLVLGPTDQAGRVFVVARQGATGDVPKRVAAVLRRGSGAKASPRLPAADSPRPAVVDRQPAVSAPTAISPASPLILGLVTGSDAMARNPAEADRLAAELGERLGVALRPRLFDSETALAEWFLRFRMVDLAVIGEPARRDPLVGDYQLLQRLTAAGGAPALLVARRDLPVERLQAFAQRLAAGEPPVVAAVPTAPESTPPPVAATPVPAVPSPPEPPVWPVMPDVPAPPVLPVAPPAPALPPVAEWPVAPEEPVAPTIAAPPEAPAAPVVVAEPAAEAFPMPAAAAPIPPEQPALPADLPAVGLPLPAAPVEAVPVTVTPAEPPPAVAAPEPVPAVVPELPFVPVPPREVAEAPAPPLPAAASPPPVAPPAAPPLPVAETPVVVPVAEAPVVVPVAEAPVVTPVAEAPVVTPVAEAPVVVPVVETPVVVPVEPPAPARVATAETLPETIPGLPFVPVPPRTIAAAQPPDRAADQAVPPAGAGDAAAPEVPAAAAEEAPWVLAGAGEVPAVIAQPDLPQELRPPGVPLPRPGRLPKAPPAEEPVLVAKLQAPLPRTPKPPPLLPEADPEPGVVYILPFISLMVPPEVQERVFDQFVDALNQRGAERKLKFVIVKQELDEPGRAWLAARKHARGEIYGYVEESGCCSTDLRTRARLAYYLAHQAEPAMKYEYPVRTFFDHDRSTLAVERQKLADQIAGVLVEELFKAFQP